MTRVRKEIAAAGAVVLRGKPGQREVLVVHRPRYDDWTLPKGKMAPDEYLPVTAVREVREETGYQIRLLAHVDTTRYQVGGRPKFVQWWLGELTGTKASEHDDEVDQVEWWPIDKAISKLTLASDVSVLVRALRAKESTLGLIVRHTKAMARKSWHGQDVNRRLTERGRRQAKALVGLFAAFDIEVVASSSATRCAKTVQPYANKANRKLQLFPALTEEQAAERPAGVGESMAKILKSVISGKRTVVCGHRPVLPEMLRAWGLHSERTLKPGEVVVTSFAPNGKVLRTMNIVPKF